jgi:hypothetical protein
MNDMTRRNAIKTATAAGMAAVTGSAMAAEDKRPRDKDRKDMWRAWATTGGMDTKLTVEGILENGGPGLVAVLKPTMPQGFNPKILMLELTLATLPGMWATVLSPIPTCYVQAPYKKGQYEAVQVRYPDGYFVNIKNITDAGDGPKKPEKNDK